VTPALPPAPPAAPTEVQVLATLVHMLGDEPRQGCDRGVPGPVSLNSAAGTLLMVFVPLAFSGVIYG
jgi:hypothetical protein